MSQYANWLIRTTSIFLVIPLHHYPTAKLQYLESKVKEMKDEK